MSHFFNYDLSCQQQHHHHSHHHQQHYQHQQHHSQQRSVLIVGNLTAEELLRVREAVAAALGGDVQSMNFPSQERFEQHHRVNPKDEETSSNDALHSPSSFLEGLHHSKPGTYYVPLIYNIQV